MRYKKGFTLVEVMVAVVILAILSAIVSILLIRTLGAAKRAAAVAVVRNEGAYTMAVLSQSLKFAQSVSNCSSGTQIDMVSGFDNGQTSFRCTNSGGIGGIASVSAIMTSKLTSDKVNATSCSIVCPPGTTNEVDINFTLVPSGTSGSITDTASVNFDMQVFLRNVK